MPALVPQHPTARARIVSLAALATIAACGTPGSDLDALPTTPAFRVDTVATGLEVPWDMAFAPDGRIFLTERPGRVRVIRNDQLLDEPWAEFDVATRSEIGLMGIALAPDFERTGEVFVVGGYEGADELENRIYRLTDREGRGVDPQLILDGMPAGRFHAGAALDFGPDGWLYVSAGDALRPGSAQEMVSLGGKILRVSRDGTVPHDNPFPGSPIYALGLRNVQGLSWHPETGELFSAGHGPTMLPTERFRRGGDEVNVIAAGGNYGWPDAAGMEDGDRYPLPIAAWTPAIAPGAAAFYTGPYAEWRNDLFVAALRGESLLRLSVEPDPEARSGWMVAGVEPLFQGEYGRIRAVGMGPDGYLYFTTSNRDGRGEERQDDDMLLRIRVGE